MTTSVQAKLRRDYRYTRFDMKGDHRVRQGSLRRERISCSDQFQHTQDWVNGVGMSPSGRFQVIEEAKPRQQWISAEGIRWDLARFLLILIAALMVAVLLAHLASIGASSLQIRRLEEKIEAAQKLNEDYRAKLEASSGDISVCTEAVKLNMISSNGAKTITLTAPTNAGILPLESHTEEIETGWELRSAVETN